MITSRIPNALMITDVSITNYHRTYVNKSISGIYQRKATGIQWFKGNITLTAYGYDSVRSLNGFLAGLKGRLNNFTLPLGGAYANPDIGSNPTLSAVTGRGATQVTINHTGSPIAMGSVFTLPNDTKLYTLLDDVSQGLGTYRITPALKKGHSQAEVLNFINPEVTVLLDDNETTINHQGNGVLATASLPWTEHIT